MNTPDDAEYAETIDFPVQCDVGAPMPVLLANDYNQFLIFYTSNSSPQKDTRDNLAIVEFLRCVSVKFGAPNDEILQGHSLYEKGLQPYSVQIVHNSRWLKELEEINKVHSRYNRDFWRSLHHYVFWFHDSTFECVAASYEIQVVHRDLAEVVAQVSERLVQ